MFKYLEIQGALTLLDNWFLPLFGLANVPIVETSFPELAVNFLDFLPWKPLPTFSILLVSVHALLDITWSFSIWIIWLDISLFHFFMLQMIGKFRVIRSLIIQGYWLTHNTNHLMLSKSKLSATANNEKRLLKRTLDIKRLLKRTLDIEGSTLQYWQWSGEPDWRFTLTILLIVFMWVGF